MKKFYSLLILASVLFSCSEKKEKSGNAMYDQNQSANEPKGTAVETGLELGDVAPEINLNSPEGLAIPLSSFRGKIVLVDFWASWCGPCRGENPNNVALYKKYKDKGLEIYGVSLDRSQDAWVKAIKDDNLTWTHVSDLGYWNSSVVPLYRISGIPATYLLDRKGKIIAKDLRGAELAKKLEEVFGS